MTRAPIRARTAGFTLVEALIATFLTMVILGALATVTAQWLPNWDRGLVRMQRVELLAAGLDRLIADLAAAEFVSTGGANDPPLFNGSENAVTFVRTTLGPNTFAGLEVVRIAEMSDDRGPALIRMAAPFAMSAGGPDGSRLNFSLPVVVVRSPYRIRFSYAGPDRVWRESWRGMAQLPRAVRVMVGDAATYAALAASTYVAAEVPARCVTANTFAECAANGSASNSGNATTAGRAGVGNAQVQ